MKITAIKANAKCVFVSLLIALSLATGTSYAKSTGGTPLLVFKTNQAGMQRVTYDDILAAGVDLEGLRHGRFALLQAGEPVAISTGGQNQGSPVRFGPGGYIDFYAQLADDLYTSQRAFVLVYNGPRKSMATDNRKPGKGAPTVTDYLATLPVEQNRYYDYLSPSKTDPWHFGQVFSFQNNPGTSVDFVLDDLVGNSAELSVNVYGIVDVPSDVNDHHISASINGVEVGDEQFDGNIEHTLTIPSVPVNPGANTFRMGLKPIAENPFDAVGLNKIVLRYQRSTVAQDDTLQGQFEAGEVEVVGVSENGESRVYRLEEDGAVTQLTRASSDRGVVRFSATTAGEYVVVGPNGFQPVEISAFPQLENIKSGNAEYLIISHANFMGATLDTLAQLRAVDYSVKVVDVSQIYAHYSDTLPSAEAISAYIKHAVANMGTRFVTLVGSDTLDYKNFGGTDSISFVPTRYAETPGGQLFIRQTPSDASYGDIDEDGVPDVPVGRLSVRTPEELATVVGKIQAYQARNGYAGRILMAADQEDLGNGISFSDDVEAMITSIPQQDWQNSLRPDYRALPDFDGGQVARDKVVAAINAGVSVTSYIGHSSQRQWSRTSPAVLKTSDIDGLLNAGKPTLVTQWGCWNTYFVDPKGNNMADRFLVGGDHGAVTVLGASTLTTSEGERGLGIELNKRMYQEGKTIGEAVIEAKQALAQLSDSDLSDVLLGWQIIGDPALVVNP